MLNERGDTTISWSEDRNDAMEAIIEKKMKEGVSFFIIEDRGLRQPLKNSQDARKYRSLAIPDADLAKFVASGAGEAIPTPEAPIKTKRKAKTAKDAAENQSVGVKPLKGG
jgi:hypothetical protein